VTRSCEDVWKGPRKLLNRIRQNSEMNISVLPFLFSPSNVLNSLCKFVINVFQIMVCRDGINQILVGIIIIPRNVLAQLIERFMILVDGSNTENRLLVIFRLWGLL
jgi:hypothetical protein